MIESEVKNLLKQLAAGEKNVDEVMLKLKMEPFENLGFADNVEDLYLILCLNQYVPSEKQYESRSKLEKNLHETDTQ